MPIAALHAQCRTRREFKGKKIEARVAVQFTTGIIEVGMEKNGSFNIQCDSIAIICYIPVFHSTSACAMLQRLKKNGHDSHVAATA